MKKLLLIPIVCFMLHFSTNAQEVKVGVTAGAAFANYDIKLGDITLSEKTRIGFAAGLTADIPLSKDFSFRPAVNFVQKGTKDRITNNGSLTDESLNVNCLEVPLNFLFNVRGNAGNFFIGAGPSLTYSISGTWTESQGTESSSEKVAFGTTEADDMTRFDIGANFLIGYCLKNGLMLSFNYNAGFSNLMPVSSDGSFKSHYAGIKVGFLFGGTGKK